MPKISIITPVYVDTEPKVNWLVETIDSVRRQSLTDWEMILINDKSPMSLDYVKSKYSGDERLRWFENSQNFGTAMTRNTAVALAESDCILPLDSDDLLGDNETLEIMYDAWLIDKTRIVYGNVQLLTPVTPTSFKLGRVVELASYSFENTMDLRGTLPVTCLHSKDCHYQAVAEVAPGHFVSGWKSVLKHGREDVEYWIAAGKRGFCGLKIDHTTLIYRKHQQSRDYRLKENRRLDEMQALIKNLW